MKIKVYNGTKEDRHLCPTCKFAHIVQGQRDSEQITTCNYGPMMLDGGKPIVIKFRVADCNIYKEKDDSNSLYAQMQQSATYMYKLASGRIVGLHLGQLQDSAFIRALRIADGEPEKPDYAKEAKKVLTAK